MCCLCDDTLLKEIITFCNFSIGDYNLKISESSERKFKIAKMVRHPLYNNFFDDIGLFKLSKPAVFGSYIQPVCLPSQGEKVGTGTVSTVTGKIRSVKLQG